MGILLAFACEEFTQWLYLRRLLERETPRLWVAAFAVPCYLPGRKLTAVPGPSVSGSRSFGHFLRSELVLIMNRLACGGIPSFFAAPLSPSSRLKRLQSVLSARCSGFRPTGAPC
jgi:hypothetical protein